VKVRLTGVLVAMLAACGGNPESPKALVERSLGALDDGDARAVKRLMVPTRMLRAYLDCDRAGGFSEDERWRLYDAYRDAGVEGAATTLKGKGVSPATCPVQLEDVKSFARGDPHDEGCQARLPFKTQSATLECYPGGVEVRVNVELVELAGRWWVGWLREGRGYNN
jgi:hypothetical protein